MAREFGQLAKGVKSLHPIWQAWSALLVLVNGILPFVFLPHVTAIVAIAATAASALLAFVLLRLHGFCKLIGAAHLPWLPMIAAQIALHPGFGAFNAYVLWLSASIAATSLSLAIDAADVRTYLRERKIMAS